MALERERDTPFYKNVLQISRRCRYIAWFDDGYYLAMNEWNYGEQVIVSQVVDLTLQILFTL